MIIDSLANSCLYSPLNPLFAAAFRFLSEHDLGAMPAGRYEISGDDLFFMISDSPLRTEADAPLEAHDKYIDIQLVLDGSETYGWSPRHGCRQPRGPMDTQTDLLFFDDPHEFTFTLAPGDFCIFFPSDAHAPLIGDPAGKVRKCVVKVKV